MLNITNKILPQIELSKNNKVNCIKIEPNGEVNVVNLHKTNYDNSIGLDSDVNYNDFGSFDNIVKHMNVQFCCDHYVLNVAKAFHPSDTNYHVFYQANEGNTFAFNKIGTHLINSTYFSAEIYTKKKCFGKCYVIHCDKFNRLFDTSYQTFSVLYNKIYTAQTGQEEREYSKRLFLRKMNGTDFFILMSDLPFIPKIAQF